MLVLQNLITGKNNKRLIQHLDMYIIINKRASQNKKKLTQHNIKT